MASPTRCSGNVVQNVKRSHQGVAALARYATAVYHDENVNKLSRTDLLAIASSLGWRYHVTLQLEPWVNISCVEPYPKDGGFRWDACAAHKDASEGIKALYFPHPYSMISFNDFGVWLPAGVPTCETAPAWVPDGGFVEVLRIGGLVTRGEHGAAGCWFLRARGSGVFLNVGRSLRARNRAALARQLAAFDSSILSHNRSWSRIHDMIRRDSPWGGFEGRLDPCRHVAAAGYDSFQVSAHSRFVSV